MVDLPEKWQFKRGDRVRVVKVYDGLPAKVGDEAVVIADVSDCYYRVNHSIVHVQFDPPRRPGRDSDGGYWVCQFERAGGPW